MKRNPQLLFFLVFMFFGVLFTAIGAGTFIKSMLFRQTALVATGTVTENLVVRKSDGGFTYYPLIEFTAENGQRVTFQNKLGTNPPQFGTGESVTVYYDEKNPQRAEVKSTLQWLMSSVFLGFGLVFGSIGALMGVRYWKKKKMISWLRAHGQRIDAAVIGVEQDTSVKINGRSPFVVRAQWDAPDDKVYIYASDSLWHNPAAQLGKTIPVLIDPANPRRYYIDLSGLPEVIEA